MAAVRSGDGNPNCPIRKRHSINYRSRSAGVASLSNITLTLTSIYFLIVNVLSCVQSELCLAASKIIAI